MIVGDMFPDDNLDLAWKQHDVYREALEIIVQRTNRFCRAARHVLRDERHSSWGTVVRVDHRTLQVAHDIVAAAWRWMDTWRNPELGYASRNYETLEEAWLGWLREEVDGWIDQPEVIRLVQVILSNQNEDVGYVAETKLGLILIDRFPSVDWMPMQREALLKDSFKYDPGILEDPVDRTQKPFDAQNTYLLDDWQQEAKR
jgi:hypothetical protein